MKRVTKEEKALPGWRSRSPFVEGCKLEQVLTVIRGEERVGGGGRSAAAGRVVREREAATPGIEGGLQLLRAHVAVPEVLRPGQEEAKEMFKTGVSSPFQTKQAILETERV
jgi:hypothetical protein